MDTIFISELRIETVVGIFEWERSIKQEVVLDIEMAADVAKAAATDRIDDTLDYKTISKRVIAMVSESQYQLVETLAEQVAQLILREFSVEWVRVKLNKMGAIRGAKGVGVIIERKQG